MNLKDSQISSSGQRSATASMSSGDRFAAFRAAENRLVESIDANLDIRQVQVGSFTINFAQAGSGPPLILLHGLNVGWGQWYKNIKTFASHFTVYAVDMPCAGGSTWKPIHKLDLKADYVDVLARFVETLKLQDVSLVAHSFGGWLALSVALENRIDIRQIVVSGSLGFNNHVPVQYKAASLGPLVKFITSTALRPSPKVMAWLMTSIMDPPGESVSEEFVSYFYQAVMLEKRKHPFFVVNRFSKFNRLVPEMDLRDRLSSIEQPVLIIHGAKDTLSPLKQARPFFDLIPNARIEIVDDMGHLPNMEKSQLFNELVLKFCR